MRSYQRLILAALVGAAMTACDRAPAQAPGAADDGARAEGALWFLCDGIDAPLILFATEAMPDGATRFTEFDKTSAQTAVEKSLRVGRAEAAAGSVVTPLEDGAAAFASVRTLNPGALADPSAAYTAPVTSVSIGGRDITCRWLERTRIAGFTTRRSVVVSEDADGDLIYRAYDFSNAQAQPIALDGAQRTSPFSIEVRGGAEETGPEGATYRFESNGVTYVVAAPEAGSATLAVLRGAQTVQMERMIAHLTPPRNE